MSDTKFNSICIGTGLVALDVIISNDSKKAPQFLAGGSCGNVLTILSYLGWKAFPIARLSNNGASDLLMKDLNEWGVKDNLLTFSTDGSTPIIIHRILKDKQGFSKHRFEFRNPEDGKYLPSYKPCLSKSVEQIVLKSPVPKVFYFDRINRASIDLAIDYKEKGAIIFFEPSSAKDEKGFKKCAELADIVKFSEERIPNYSKLFLTGIANLEVQTLGKDGIKYRRKDSEMWEKVKGYEVDLAVDTAGAGDWCSAGIIATLFNANTPKKTFTNQSIKNALKFGQALSALNCTYEGARGLMYNIKRKELLAKVDQIFTSKTHKIAQPKHVAILEKTPKEPVKIASLFHKYSN